MIQCPNCGKDLEIETAKFCTHCGADLIQKQVIPSPLTQRRISGRPSYRPWLIIIGSIVTIGIIFFSVILAGTFFLSSLFGPSLGSGIEIFSDTDFLEYSSSGTGTQDDPYMLSNYYLTNQFIGFSIEDTTKHFIITNCTIDLCYEAIHIENIAPGTGKIDNNTIFHSDCWVWETGPRAGIVIYSSPGVIISNNTIYNTGIEGVLIEQSEKCNVSNNSIWDQHNGIYLEYSDSSIISGNVLKLCYDAVTCFESHLVNITQNICINNGNLCFDVGLSDHVYLSNNYCFNTTDNVYPRLRSGIILTECNNCTVTNCTIIACHRGIDVPSSSNCRIVYNYLENNSEFGVYFSAQFNSVYLNSFINNNYHGVSQAVDDGTSNYWYNVELEQGNFWSNWNGTGSYAISGTANATDIFPLSEPPV